MTPEEIVRAWVGVEERMGKHCLAHPEPYDKCPASVQMEWSALCAEHQALYEQMRAWVAANGGGR